MFLRVPKRSTASDQRLFDESLEATVAGLFDSRNHRAHQLTAASRPPFPNGRQHKTARHATAQQRAHSYQWTVAIAATCGLQRQGKTRCVRI
ncbi:MAG: hypothetical protein KatS3mg058_4127 [Roseiflexus sp.]|nr:MAG: hypothetical protein KatS3mg058_4127 [Roseiflexus sp.]